MSQSPYFTCPRSLSWNRSWHSVPGTLFVFKAVKKYRWGGRTHKEAPRIFPHWILIINTQGSIWMEWSGRLYFKKSFMLFYWLHFKSKSAVTFQKTSANLKKKIIKRKKRGGEKRITAAAVTATWNDPKPFLWRCNNIVSVFDIWTHLVWFGLISFILNQTQCLWYCACATATLSICLHICYQI